MDKIRLQYVAPYIKPFTNIYNNIPINDNIYIKQIETKIDKMGFPGCQILEIIRESSDTFISGSFLLHFLTEPTEWFPNDIDVFTTDPTLHKRLAHIMKDYARGRFGFNELSHMTAEYMEGLSSNIDNLYEWVSNDEASKFQIIVTNITAEKAIEGFDLNIVKSKFNGHILQIPPETVVAIHNKGEFLHDQYPSLRTLNGALIRTKKYTERGYTIYLPINISFDYPGNYIWKTFYSEVDKYYNTDGNSTIKLKEEQTDFSYYDNSLKFE